ncbi:DNA cytosine methyltransferase [Cypionkella sinensis]|uniref:DNA (cytosine-5-)-methyltransferase n=1 Tax=Cypionkella sinensis TaxID=1756043 RepID=A0ABV7IZF2_9RHOB
MAVHPPKRHEDLRGLSLCAGVGGLDLGIHLAEPGYRTVGYVERNAFSAATLVARMADEALAPALVWDDLRSFDGRPWRRRIHIVSAGYPCQPFSYAGHRKGEDDPRHLWPEVARILREAEPEWAFFENVSGHLSLGFDVVAGSLQEMGYRVAACVVSAAEVGGSHIRDRLFILAHADRHHGRKPGLPRDLAERGDVPARPQPSRQTDRHRQCSTGLDALVGHADGSGLGAEPPGLFPPLPGDFAEWGTALRQQPELKPCIHRLDDGLASWVDRTVSAGNGVVPLAAARAWRMLKAELMV